MKNKKIVLLDTNALFIPLLFKIDIKGALFDLIDTPFEVYILDVCIKELEKKIANTKSVKFKQEAKFALGYSKQFKAITASEYPTGTDVDSIIINEAIKYSAIVITNDKMLRQKLSKAGVTVISIRGNKKLDFVR